ncbi:hypothetical protein [Rhizobium sp. LjRoot258]|uniref:hypothetical protein n=1 Tax=Rhizobium sp. LjRoot258 TaxID=3342299 RepID=UPI003ECE2507
MANDQPWILGGWANIDVVQTSNNGHSLPQLVFLMGCCPGQQGISSIIFMPVTELMSSLIAGSEEAIALPANSMLAGPTTTATMATNRNR